MKSRKQLLSSIKRYQYAFWKKQMIDRPPVAVLSDRLLLPVRYLKSEFDKKYLSPDDVHSTLFYSDYEYDMQKRAVISDDWMPFSAPWRAIPWLEALCGCPVRYSSGSLAPEAWVNSLDGLLDTPLHSSEPWLQTMMDLTKEIAISLPDDCWLSPSILRGPSDVLAAMLGMEQFMYELCVQPQKIDQMAFRITNLMLTVLSWHFNFIEPKLGGYGHIYGYWAPDKTMVIQEDIMGLCDPQSYGQIFKKYNQLLVTALGSCVFFHLHSTGLQHYRDVIKMTGLAGVQITVEANGPSLSTLIPIFQDSLQNSRLILFIDGFFDELPEMLRKIPLDGLFLIVSDRFITTDTEYQDFIRDNFSR